MWDSSVTCYTVSSRIQRNSMRFKCKADHKSFVFPTDKISGFQKTATKLKRKQSTCDSELNSEDTISSDQNDYFENSNIEIESTDNSDQESVKLCDTERLQNTAENLLTKFQSVVEENEQTLKLKYEDLEKELNICKSSYNSLLNGYNELYYNYGFVVEELNKNTTQLKEVSAELDSIMSIYESEHQKSKHLNELFTKVKSDIKNVQKKVIVEKRKNRILQSKFDVAKPLMSEATTSVELVDIFKIYLNEISTKKNRSVTRLSKVVIEELWHDTTFKGSLKQKMIEKVREYYRNNIFSPSKLLKAMDMAGGQLSMQGISVLRNIESAGIKFYHSSILPSSGKIKRTCQIVDEYASRIVPFKEGTLETGGEYAKFDPVNVMNLMIKAYNLNEVAKYRSIKINQAIDAALITTNMHHTTYGLKMIDKAAYDPVTKRLIYASTDSSTLQSRNNCFPLMIVLRRETKELLQEFTPIMKEVHNQSVSGPYNFLSPYFPIKTAFDSDMSATWKLCGKGGAMKRELYPCHCCAIHDSNIALPNHENCSRWCNELHADDPNWKCYHHELLDERNVEKLRVTLQTLSTEISHIIPDITRRDCISRMNSKEDPRAMVDKNQANDPMSIHFDYNNPIIEKITIFEYSN
jgi:uncharacterized protein